MNAVLADINHTYSLESSTILVPLQEQMVRGARSALWMLLGTVGMVLLIVCVNVGNLMIVRTAGRYREAGVRLALGASRGHLFGLVLTEALVLVAAGGAVGLGLACAGLQLFRATAPIEIPRLEEVQMDWRVLAFAAAATTFSVVTRGLFPCCG